jgi:hypothetical protein
LENLLALPLNGISPLFISSTVVKRSQVRISNGLVFYNYFLLPP